MRLSIVSVLGQYILGATAAVYTIDAGCSHINVGEGKTIDARQAIADSFREAIETIETAYNTLEQHAEDDGVKNICKILFGEDAGKVAQAKATLGRLKDFAKDPTPFTTDDPQWRQQRTNDDVEIYCDMNRFNVVHSDSDRFPTKLINTAMDEDVALPSDHKYYTKLYTPGSSFKTMARTLDSDFFDANRWRADRDKGMRPARDDPAYSTPRTHLPSQMDLATAYMQTVIAYENPKLDEGNIEIRTREDFVTAYVAENPAKRSPVDAVLQTLAHTLIHELTHTVRGGYLLDTPSKEECYRWKCIQVEKNPKNSDTVAWFADALRLWTMGYTINEAGDLSKFH